MQCKNMNLSICYRLHLVMFLLAYMNNLQAYIFLSVVEYKSMKLICIFGLVTSCYIVLHREKNKIENVLTIGRLLVAGFPEVRGAAIRASFLTKDL